MCVHFRGFFGGSKILGLKAAMQQAEICVFFSFNLRPAPEFIFYAPEKLTKLHARPGASMQI